MDKIYLLINNWRLQEEDLLGVYDTFEKAKSKLTSFGSMKPTIVEYNINTDAVVGKWKTINNENCEIS